MINSEMNNCFRETIDLIDRTQLTHVGQISWRGEQKHQETRDASPVEDEKLTREWKLRVNEGLSVHWTGNT